MRTCAPRGSKTVQPDECLKQSGAGNDTHHSESCDTTEETICVVEDNADNKCDSDSESLGNSDDEQIDCESTWNNVKFEISKTVQVCGSHGVIL